MSEHALKFLLIALGTLRNIICTIIKSFLLFIFIMF